MALSGLNSHTMSVFSWAVARNFRNSMSGEAQCIDRSRPRCVTAGARGRSQCEPPHQSAAEWPPPARPPTANAKTFSLRPVVARTPPMRCNLALQRLGRSALMMGSVVSTEIGYHLNVTVPLPVLVVTNSHDFPVHLLSKIEPAAVAACVTTVKHPSDDCCGCCGGCC